MALGTPEEIAMTPRNDEEAESLALGVSDGVVAPEPIYERILWDLVGIRTTFPDLSSLRARVVVCPSELNLQFDDEGFRAVQNDSYDAWACLNAHYRVVSASTSLGGWVSLAFEGRYRIYRLARQYTQLEHVVSAVPSTAPGDGDMICVRVEGQSYHYLFSRGFGDCEAGCIGRAEWGFTTAASGALTYLGSSSDGTLDPEWREAGFHCGQDVER
jgi:hypothetical protein